MLIPQSLAYAKIATISGEFGLMSSWLPNFLYFIMGTSKGKY
jgi:sodium-independent sulfate anion transporter 11